MVKIKHSYEINTTKDKDGIVYKNPHLSCKQCGKYPCFIGQEKSKLDYAKYGCIKYEDI